MTPMKFIDCVDITGGAVKHFSGTRMYLSTGALQGNQIITSALEEVTYDNGLPPNFVPGF